MCCFSSEMAFRRSEKYHLARTLYQSSLFDSQKSIPKIYLLTNKYNVIYGSGPK
jgi:hypothetical protein